MFFTNDSITSYNDYHIDKHLKKLDLLNNYESNIEEIIAKVANFNIAIPSWALGAGGTRFGRFAIGGEPRNLIEKLSDVAILNNLTQNTDAISLHIPWDIPEDYESIKNVAHDLKISFDAVNSNTFQDQLTQEYSYKFGSFQNTNPAVRKQAIKHNLDVIQHGINLGSKCLSIWLSDGSCFPGQINFRRAFENTFESIAEIYGALPADWKILIEYKAYEPNFYSTTIPDWGHSFLIANKLGNKAFTLVDLGHHLPNTNIEQIVATLIMENKLGGFHFNDSKYGDDDLTAGSIKPYQLFLIFKEIKAGLEANSNFPISFMIDASHNVKDPLEDLLQSVDNILIAYAQSLLIDEIELHKLQANNDVVAAQELVQNAFRTDVRPIIAEARIRKGGVLNTLDFYRKFQIRKKLIQQRGANNKATGL